MRPFGLVPIFRNQNFPYKNKVDNFFIKIDKSYNN